MLWPVDYSGAYQAICAEGVHYWFIFIMMSMRTYELVYGQVSSSSMFSDGRLTLGW